MLYIWTGVWVLRTPNTGLNMKGEESLKEIDWFDLYIKEEWNNQRRPEARGLGGGGQMAILNFVNSAAPVLRRRILYMVRILLSHEK